MSKRKFEAPRTRHWTRRKLKIKLRKTRSQVKRGRSWMADPLLVRFYRKVIIPFFENVIPTTVSEYEAQLSTFFGTDYRDVYHAKVVAPFRIPGNLWVGDSPYSVSPKWGKRDTWPSQRIMLRFDRRDGGNKVTLEIAVNKEVNQTYSLTGDDWKSIMDKVQIIVPLYLKGRSEHNVNLIREQHARSIRTGLGPDVKIKYVNRR